MGTLGKNEILLVVVVFLPLFNSIEQQQGTIYSLFLVRKLCIMCLSSAIIYSASLINKIQNNICVIFFTRFAMTIERRAVRRTESESESE